MQIFHCDHCENLVFFENFKCLSCGNALAFLPDLAEIGSLEPAPDGIYHSPAPDAKGRSYRLCQNYVQGNVCNWAIPADDPSTLCISCRLTRVIPDLSVPANPSAWYKLEVAKRRLVYSLMSLGLPVADKTADPENGLAFEFLADPPPNLAAPEGANPPPDAKAPAPVLTGHANGVITINIAEVDDVERERRRTALHEPYRTLLGHFRHEVGHYYWDQLIQGTDRLEPFRKLFGDEREDYGAALQKHYQQGAPANWQDAFISVYATSHPWEDWAETWAHYLHMVDALETSMACGLSLRPLRSDEPAIKPARRRFWLWGSDKLSFQDMINRWLPLTYVLNSLNRGLGQADSYPFVISPPVIEKLKFVHETVSKT